MSKRSVPVEQSADVRYVAFHSNAASMTHVLSNFAPLSAPIKLFAATCDRALYACCPELQRWLSLSRSELTAALGAASPGEAVIDTWYPYLDISVDTPCFQFATSEALWQSLKARTLAAFVRFTTQGDLGTLTLAFYTRMDPKNPDKALTKYKTWARKGNHGIVPKLASNPTHAKKLGFRAGDMAYEREKLSSEMEAAVWAFILKLKFSTNPGHATILRETGDHYLLERDNRAKSGTYWAGRFVDGKLVGTNAMGRYMMNVRRVFNEKHWC